MKCEYQQIIYPKQNVNTGMKSMQTKLFIQGSHYIIHCRLYQIIQVLSKQFCCLLYGTEKPIF